MMIVKEEDDHASLIPVAPVLVWIAAETEIICTGIMTKSWPMEDVAMGDIFNPEDEYTRTNLIWEVFGVQLGPAAQSQNWVLPSWEWHRPRKWGETPGQQALTWHQMYIQNAEDDHQPILMIHSSETPATTAAEAAPIQKEWEIKLPAAIPKWPAN